MVILLRSAIAFKYHRRWMTTRRPSAEAAPGDPPGSRRRKCRLARAEVPSCRIIGLSDKWTLNVVYGGR